MKINEDKIHKRRLWSKVHHFSYQDIRISGCFYKWENVIHAIKQLQCIEEPTSSLYIDHNGDPQHTKNLKKKERMKMCLKQKELEIFFH